jgi:hypothetical protein
VREQLITFIVSGLLVDHPAGQERTV